jgi:hypothetical protein
MAKGLVKEKGSYGQSCRADLYSAQSYFQGPMSHAASVIAGDNQSFEREEEGKRYLSPYLTIVAGELLSLPTVEPRLGTRANK